jgi:hypothetical protein
VTQARAVPGTDLSVRSPLPTVVSSPFRVIERGNEGETSNDLLPALTVSASCKADPIIELAGLGEFSAGGRPTRGPVTRMHSRATSASIPGARVRPLAIPALQHVQTADRLRRALLPL